MSRGRNSASSSFLRSSALPIGVCGVALSVVFYFSSISTSTDYFKAARALIPSDEKVAQENISQTPQPTVPAVPAVPSVPIWSSLSIVLATSGPDAVGWDGAPAHVAGNPHICVDPAPFGSQCTMHATDALSACLAIPGCAALTCPDPAPYNSPRPDLRTHGPVCQARRTPSAQAWLAGKDLEAGHGMCVPSGCADFFLIAVPRDRLNPAVVAALDAALPPAPAPPGAAPLTPAPLWALDASIQPALLSLLGLDTPATASVAVLDAAVVGGNKAASSQTGAWVLAKGTDDPAAAQLGHPPPAGQALPAWATLQSRLKVFRSSVPAAPQAQAAAAP
jgi:hypothetical protein